MARSLNRTLLSWNLYISPIRFSQSGNSCNQFKENPVTESVIVCEGTRLFSRSVIAVLSVYAKRGKLDFLWLLQFDLDFVPFSVPANALGTVTKQILVTQHGTHGLCDLCQVIGIINGEGCTTRHLRDLAQQVRSRSLFRGRKPAVIKTDPVENDTQGNRRVFAREITDILGMLAFKYLEVILS